MWFKLKKVPSKFWQMAKTKLILARDLISLSVIFTENWFISVFWVYPEIWRADTYACVSARLTFFLIFKLRKRVKNRRFLNFDARTKLFVRIDFFHILQNLSLNLLVIFFLKLPRTMKIFQKQMVQGLYEHPVLRNRLVTQVETGWIFSDNIGILSTLASLGKRIQKKHCCHIEENMLGNFRTCWIMQRFLNNVKYV
jgi:hypothetical protein